MAGRGDDASAPVRQRPSLFEPDLRPAATEGRRHLAWRLLFHHDTPAERNFDLGLIAAIILSVLVVLLDSEPSLGAGWHRALLISEWLFTIAFTVEYGVRLWAVRRPLRYAFSFFGIIDLLAILPSFLSLLIVGGQYLLVIRVLRLLRIFRILKLVQYSSEAGVLITALLRARRKIAVFVFTVLTIVIIFGTLMYVIEGPEHGFTSIPTAMYWAVVTMGTVGFGDIAPGTSLGRFITSVLILIGYSVIAVPTGIYTAELASTLRPQRRHVRCPECALSDHEQEAWHCRRCGHSLPVDDASA